MNFNHDDIQIVDDMSLHVIPNETSTFTCRQTSAYI